MAAEQSQNELTTTIHLGLREVSNSSEKHLEEQLALLSPEDRAVVAEIQGSKGEKAMILIARGANKGSRFLVTAEGVSVGRSASSSIFLDDVTVSRTHATISKQDNSFVLKDEGSLNGTYINNISVTEHVLVSGDEFQIGKFHLLFVGSN
ncbi:Forkhead-associated (FHA) domain [Candidatus Nanopelagicaceae bacterium]